MKNIQRILIGAVLLLLLSFSGGTLMAQCPSQGNGNGPGQGYIINQAKKDPWAAGFFGRGSTEAYDRTITVHYNNDGYTIEIVDTPRCNGNDNYPCPPFAYLTLIVLDCGFNVVAIAQS